MPPITLLDIAKANGSDALVGLVEETIKAHPELRVGEAREITGLSYKTLVCTAVPDIAFRAANEGAPSKQGVFESRVVMTYIVDTSIEADRAVADRYEDGAEAYLALQGIPVMRGVQKTLAKCFYYGTGSLGDAKGYPGLLQSYDSTNMVVDAGGTTDNVASSVWAVRFGVQDVRWVWGANGLLELGEVRTERLTDGSGNPYEGYRMPLLAYPGLQVLSIYSIGRIKKLTTDSGKGLTDSLLDQLLEKFPAGMPPNAMFMTRRSRRQLKNSRTATTPTGKTAEWPDEIDGPEGPIPIYSTDSILNTETLAL